MKIPCALIESRVNNKATACTHKQHPCMHRLRGKCYWVEAGDTEEFITRRDMSTNKFNSEARRSVSDIKTLFLVDRFYEFLRAEHSMYPKLDQAITDLEFPFNYPGHIWSIDLVNVALSESSVEAFAKHLPDKSIDTLIESLEILRSFFDNSN